MSDKPQRPRPSPEQLARYSQAFNDSLPIRHLGIRVAFVGDEVHVLLDPVRPEQRGGLGTSAVNGGVLAAVFDMAIGTAPALVDPTRRTATIQLSMSFERPVLGDSFKVVAKVDSAGESTVFASAVLYDERGIACARCQGVARLGKNPWASTQTPGA